MDSRRRGQQSVHDRSGTRSGEATPLFGYLTIDRQDSLPVVPQKSREPLVERRGPGPVAPPDRLDPPPDFSDHEHAQAEIDVGDSGDPGGDPRIAPTSLA